MCTELIVFSESDQRFVREAVAYLESPSLLMKLANVLGKPVEALTSLMPEVVAEIVDKALRKAMGFSIDTVQYEEAAESFREADSEARWSALLHQVATAVTGGAAGLFGLPGLAVELPLTTCIMFRSIAAIAQEFGMDISDPATRLECLAVFAQGGPTPDDNAMESTYFETRLTLQVLVKNAAAFLASHTPQEVSQLMAKGAAPTLIKFLTRVAVFFNVAVSEKFIAQSVPVIGIGGGALINAAFSGHFNSVARYHFGLRRLERLHGEEQVRQTYRAALADLRTNKRLPSRGQ